MSRANFWDLVLIGDGCWEHIRAPRRLGYVYVWEDGRNQRAHRVAWKHWYGVEPEGDVLHRCDNRRCVRPDHLYLGSGFENQRDAVERKRHAKARNTHCPAGHLFDEENTYRYPNGWRGCRVCHRETQRRYLARKRGEYHF